jgi:hypothetical protein
LEIRLIRYKPFARAGFRPSEHHGLPIATALFMGRLNWLFAAAVARNRAFAMSVCGALKQKTIPDSG